MTKLKVLQKQIGTEKEQLKSLSLIISSVESNADPSEPSAYAMTRVYRYDLEGDVDEFIKALEALKGKSAKKGFIIEGGQMSNEQY